MKLTVLGKFGPFPAPGGACSGYLLETESLSLILDLGSGTMSRLRRIKPDLKINGIILTHLHSDHMSDMLVLRYALQQLASRGITLPLPISVIAPDSPELEYRQLAASGVFDMLPIQDHMKVRFQDLSITFHRVIHPVPTYALVIEQKKKKLVYTGDTGYSDDLFSIIENADILLADTCLLQDESTGAVAAHLTTREIGTLAQQAHVKQLICTHIWGGGYTDAQVLEQVHTYCPTALIAEEMHEYYV